MESRGTESGVVVTLLVHQPGVEFRTVVRNIGRQGARIDALLVIDNGCRPPLRESDLNRWLDEDVPPTFYRSDANLGVGGGHNLLLRSASARNPRWFWMLEHDTLADPDCVQDLIDALQGSRFGRVARSRSATWCSRAVR